MLVCDPRKAKTHVDKMALDHLRACGVIFEKTKAAPKVKVGRIGWKKLGSMRNGGCQQCGDQDSQVPAGYPRSQKPGLCNRCYAVLERSRKFWIPNEDFPSPEL